MTQSLVDAILDGVVPPQPAIAFPEGSEAIDRLLYEIHYYSTQFDAVTDKRGNSSEIRRELAKSGNPALYHLFMLYRLFSKGKITWRSSKASFEFQFGHVDRDAFWTAYSYVLECSGGYIPDEQD